MRVGFVAVLGALAMVPSLSIDIMVPAIPRIASDLGTPASVAQATVGAFIGAYGIGQLVMGALLDRFGARRVVLASLVAFGLVACAGAFVSDGGWLVALRALQGFVAGAATVGSLSLAQHAARSAAEATRLQSVNAALGNLGPLVGPIAGAVLIAIGSWRWVFAALAAMAAVLFVSVLTTIHDDTAQADGDAPAGGAFSPVVVRMAATIACAFAGYFALISSSSLVIVTQFGLSLGWFTVVFAVNALAAIVGSLFVARRVEHVTPERLLRGAVLVLAVVAVAGAGVLARWPEALVYAIAFAAYGVLYGMLSPTIFSIALAAAGPRRGVVAGIVGASLCIGGAIGSACAGAFVVSHALGAAVTAAVGAVAAAVMTLGFGARPASTGSA